MKEEQKQMLLNQLDQVESLREMKDVFRTYLSNIKTDEDSVREVIKQIKLVDARSGGLWVTTPRVTTVSKGESIEPFSPNN
ncbi:hypothetical protein [Rossellomorea marisflavi]|uniref:hypothetical protein n=1 Tax=Rossellomorea marisflavi TaxID=189381 RepID=UPI003F9FD1B5